MSRRIATSKLPVNAGSVDIAVETRTSTSGNVPANKGNCGISQRMATVADALVALRQNEDLLESLNTMFLVDSQERLKAVVPVARLFLHEGATRLESLASDNLVEVQVTEKQDRVTEIFDKYNLLTLPVVDEDGKLAGVITADDVITVLRQR